MFFKEYIFSLRKFILAAVLVFVFATFSGYFSTQSSPSEMEAVLEKLREMLGPVAEMPLFGQFLFVVLNNGITAFLAVVLGIIFGIFPFLVLLSNGTILGVVAYFAKTELSWSTVFALTLPHGIIEIPVIILACAVGFKLGKTAFDKVFKNRARKAGEGEEEDKVLFAKQGSVIAELNITLNFFLKFLFPLLVLAAAIEIFITSQLL